jgi:hypothetical protein
LRRVCVITQLDDKVGGPSLEINNDLIVLNKRFELKMKKVSVGVDTQVGLTTAGKCVAAAREGGRPRQPSALAACKESWPCWHHALVPSTARDLSFC